tara:strand:- start:673 stop:876 length:204 start_codon:yes stop_codon:yes gene_type:complete
MKVKIENRTGLVRDTSNMAVINTDRNALEAAREKQRRAALDKQEIQDLKNDVAELKQMIRDLINGNN